MLRFVQSSLLITWELKQSHGLSNFDSPNYIVKNDKDNDDLFKKKGKPATFLIVVLNLFTKCSTYKRKLQLKCKTAK